MLKKEEKIPEIRFPGFTEPWEQRKLGDLIDIHSGIDYKHLKEGDIPVYGTGGLITRVNEYLSDVDGIGIGRKGTIDKPFILKAPFWTVDTLFYTIPKENNQLSFLFDLFQTIKWKALDESTGVPSLSKSTINKVLAHIPTEDEQKKIGSFFHGLDDLIAVHQRKVESLKKLKRGLLQKMFPRNGKTVPEIRFPGFTEPWEQRKVSEITGNTYGGGTPKTGIQEYWHGNLPWIQSSDLKEDEIWKVDPQKSISKLGLNNSAAKYIPKNSIAVVSRVGVGKLAVVPFDYSTSQDFLSLSDLKTDLGFTAYSIQNDIKKHAFSQGTAIKGITKEQILKCQLFFQD